MLLNETLDEEDKAAKLLTSIATGGLLLGSSGFDRSDDVVEALA